MLASCTCRCLHALAVLVLKLLCCSSAVPNLPLQEFECIHDKWSPFQRCRSSRDQNARVPNEPQLPIAHVSQSLRNTTVLFVSSGCAGVQFVRNFEIAYVISHGFGVRVESISCKIYRQEYCKNHGNRLRVTIHVGLPCACWMRQQVNLSMYLGPGRHIYDPVDKLISSGGIALSLSAHASFWQEFDAFIVGTSVVRKRLSKVTEAVKPSAIVALIPHHHSNFLGRRVPNRLAQRTNGNVVVGVAGDNSKEFMTRLKEILRRWGLMRIHIRSIDTLQGHCMHEGCWTCGFKRGDCHACQLASFDIGVVWYQKDLGAPRAPRKFIEMEKPSQRLLNMLAVGLPVVAYAGYAAHRDVVIGSTLEKLLPLASNEKAMAWSLARLVRNPRLRKRVSLASLEVSESYTSHRVARKYIDLLSKFGGARHN